MTSASSFRQWLTALKPHAIPFAWLLLPIVWFHYEIILMAGVICGGDFINQFFPWREFALAELSEGRFPGWSPYAFAGAPLAANIQTSLFYPWNLMHALFPTERLFSVSLVVHHGLAALLMYGFLYSRVGNRAAAVLGALVYAWSGFLITHAHDGHLIHVRAYACIPAALWCQSVWMDKNSLRAFWGMVLSLALMFYAGHTQIPLYVFYVLFARAVWQSIGHWPDRRSLLHGAAPIIKSLFALGLAVGVSLLVLLPLAELSQLTAGRAGGADYAFATSDSMPPSFLPAFLAPMVWGNPTAEIREASFWISTTGYHELCGYVGILTLILLPFAALSISQQCPGSRWRAILRSETTFYALLIFGGLFFALGQYNPLYPLLYYGLPGWNYFRVPARLVLVFILGASFVSAVGFAAWLSTPWKQAQNAIATKTAIIFSLLVAFSTLSVWLSKTAVIEWMVSLEVDRTIEMMQAWTASRSRIAQQLPAELFEYRFAEMITALGLATLLLALGWAAMGISKRFNAPWAAYAPVAIVLLDLVLFSRHFIEVLPQDQWRQTYYPQTAIVSFLQEEAADARVLELDSAIGHPGQQHNPELRPNRLMGYGIHSARGYDPIILNTYATAVNRLYGRSDDFPQGGLLFFSEAPNPEAFTKFATRYIVSALPLTEPYEEIWRDDESTMRIYRHPNPAPLARVHPPQEGATVSITNQSPQEIALSTSTSVETSLVFAIPFHPGWSASVNGVSIAPVPFEDTWLSVPLPIGESNVSVRFVNHSMRLGGLLSAIILAIGLIGTFLYKRTLAQN